MINVSRNLSKSHKLRKLSLVQYQLRKLNASIRIQATSIVRRWWKKPPQGKLRNHLNVSAILSPTCLNWSLHPHDNDYLWFGMASKQSSCRLGPCFSGTGKRAALMTTIQNLLWFDSHQIYLNLVFKKTNFIKLNS